MIISYLCIRFVLAMKYILSLYILLITLVCQGASPELYCRPYNTSDGLPNNTVRDITQDSHGFIWLATLNGLARFDGTNFSIFQPDATDPLSLSDNRTYNITEDKNQFLWIGTTARQYNCYDLRKGRFVKYVEGNLPSFSNIFIASNGDVWLWHDKRGAARIRHLSDRSLHTDFFNRSTGTLPDDNINCISELSAGTILVESSTGLSVIHPEANTCNTILAKEPKASIEFDNAIWTLTNEGSIYKIRNGKAILVMSVPSTSAEIITSDFNLGHLWFLFTDRGVWRINLARGSFSKDFSPNPNLRNGIVINDNIGRPWIYNNTGNLSYYSKRDDRFITLALIPSERMLQIDHERYHIVEDKNGLIWISTYGNGLYSYDPEDGKLTHFDADEPLCPIRSNYIRYMMQDSGGGLWIATEYSGITRIWNHPRPVRYIYPTGTKASVRDNSIRMISPKAGGTFLISSKASRLYSWNSAGTEMSLVRSFPSPVYSVLGEFMGSELYGTRGAGLLIGNYSYRHRESDMTSLPNDNVYFLHRDVRNRVWVGTFGGGTAIILGKRPDSLRFKSFFRDIHGLNQHRCIWEDADGRFWIGTTQGIITFLPEAILKNAKDYKVYSRNHGSLAGNEIRALFRDSKHRLWIATGDAGLVCASTNSDGSLTPIHHYSQSDGLTDSCVQSIIEDNSGDIWTGTENGLFRLDLKSGSFEKFLFSKNIPDNVYSENCASKLDDGAIVFGSNCGLILLNPSDFPKESLGHGALRFTGIKINGMIPSRNELNSALENAIDYSDVIRLKYNQNSISVDFSFIDYRSDKSYRYSYLLDGYDTSWSTPSQIASASYKNLSPGRYTLRVKCLEGGMCIGEEEIRIIVSPPWWATPLAKIIYAIAALGLLYLIYRLIMQFAFLRHRVYIEKELSEYKIKFFTNISHEFRTPLTLIIGALERLRTHHEFSPEVHDSFEIMERNSSRMLRLINQLMEFRKSEYDALKLAVEPIEFVSYSRQLFKNFSNEADKKSITLTFNTEVDTLDILADKNYVDKIEYNLISNALKYTPDGGRIEVRIALRDTLVEFSVQDTGIGVEPEKRAKLFLPYLQSSSSHDSIGIGLALSRELARKHHGDIIYRPSASVGSEFILTLPLDSSVYTSDERFVVSPLSDEDNRDKPSILDNPVSAGAPWILVVEDNPELREFLKDEIGKYFNVITACDGEDGLNKVRNYEFDLILSDIMMPKIDGRELAHIIKSDESTNHIPLILLTALGDNDNALAGYESGADAYVTKPFSMRVLLAHINRIIQQREILRAKFSSTPLLSGLKECNVSPDRAFIERLEAVAMENLSNTTFSMDDFASHLNLGRAVFYRKLKAVLGTTPNDYLKKIRLNKASQLLRNDPEITIAEVSDSVGFSDPFYFSKCFKAEYGMSPSAYKSDNGHGNRNEKV